jgi:Nucleotidyltransferase domain
VLRRCSGRPLSALPKVCGPPAAPLQAALSSEHEQPGGRLAPAGRGRSSPRPERPAATPTTSGPASPRTIRPRKRPTRHMRLLARRHGDTWSRSCSMHCGPTTRRSTSSCSTGLERSTSCTSRRGTPTVWREEPPRTSTPGQRQNAPSPMGRRSLRSVEECYRGRNVRVFRLDREGVLARLRGRAQTVLERLADVVEVRLFGSPARGDARPGSDADLFVVLHDGAPPFPERLADFTPGVRRCRHRLRRDRLHGVRESCPGQSWRCLRPGRVRRGAAPCPARVSSAGGSACPGSSLDIASSYEDSMPALTPPHGVDGARASGPPGASRLGDQHLRPADSLSPTRQIVAAIGAGVATLSLKSPYVSTPCGEYGAAIPWPSHCTRLRPTDDSAQATGRAGRAATRHGHLGRFRDARPAAASSPTRLPPFAETRGSGHVILSPEGVRPDILQDRGTPSARGLDLVSFIGRRHPAGPVILGTAFGGEDTLTEALRRRRGWLSGEALPRGASSRYATRHRLARSPGRLVTNPGDDRDTGG